MRQHRQQAQVLHRPAPAHNNGAKQDQTTSCAARMQRHNVKRLGAGKLDHTKRHKAAPHHQCQCKRPASSRSEHCTAVEFGTGSCATSRTSTWREPAWAAVTHTRTHGHEPEHGLEFTGTVESKLRATEQSEVNAHWRGAPVASAPPSPACAAGAPAFSAIQARTHGMQGCS